MAATRPLSPAAREVIAAIDCDGQHARITSGELPPATYKEVDEVLKRLGGRWRGGKTAAHVFPPEIDPAPLIELVAESGELPPRNPTQLYPTPRLLAEEVISAADINPYREAPLRVLEPSAGLGGLIRPLLASEHGARCERIDAVEITDASSRYLRNRIAAHDPRVFVHQGDFLTWSPPWAVAQLVIILHEAARDSKANATDS